MPKAFPASPVMGRYLEIPVLTTWRSTDSVDRVRSILVDHERGSFIQSALFADEIMSDDRISGVLNTRIGGILGAPLSFRAANNKKKSEKLAKILGGDDKTQSDGEWLNMVDDDTAYDILKWHILLGFAFGQKVWDTKDGKWIPKINVWHPRYCWWNWASRTFQIAINGSDPRDPIAISNPNNTIDLPRTDLGEFGDGSWFVWGSPYSWMRGLVRSLGMKYLDRQWNERDWSRYNEKHGMGIIKGSTPSTDTNEKMEFLSQLQNLGNEPTIICPQGESGMPSYDVNLVEATAKTWDTYQARKRDLDDDIAVVVLGQTLTTSTSGTGSYALGKVQDNIRIDKKREDARMFKQIRAQLIIPWASYNFGIGEGEKIAPYPEPQIEPPDDENEEATAMNQLGNALKVLKEVEPLVDVDAILESHGIPLVNPEDMPEGKKTIGNEANEPKEQKSDEDGGKDEDETSDEDDKALTTMAAQYPRAERRRIRYNRHVNSGNK